MNRSFRFFVVVGVAVLGIGVSRAGEESPQDAASGNVHLRGSLANSRIQFAHQKKGHVAFIGGSITEMNGYRPMVCEILQRRFPDTEFTFTDAGISSTCSTTGAFRLATDVLAKGPVDLFFIEFAVNDDQDAGHARRECIRGLEGIICQVRKHNPCADVVVTYFVNPGMVETYENGRVPLSIASHTEVCEHHDISTINLAKEVTEQIAAGKLTWKKFGGTHPAPFGNAICAGMIDGLLSNAWSQPLSPEAKKSPHSMPEQRLDENSYVRGRFVDPARAQTDDRWQLGVPDWKTLRGSCRQRFAAMPLLAASQPGAELTLKFTGTAVGAYVLAGPDAGIVEATIDNGPPKKVDLYHRFSRGLHYPRTVVFLGDLEPGEHTLRLRISDEKNKASEGHAARILQFAAN
jgi:lysophospholipase L1-like esterase